MECAVANNLAVLLIVETRCRVKVPGLYAAPDVFGLRRLESGQVDARGIEDRGLRGFVTSLEISDAQCTTLRYVERGPGRVDFRRSGRRCLHRRCEPQSDGRGCPTT